MDQFSTFIAQHWALASVFVLLVLILILVETQGSLSGVKHQLSTHEVVQRMNHEAALVIDLRTAEQYQQGHILGAKHIDRTQLVSKLPTLSKDKTTPVILCCDLGQSAKNSAITLRKSNYTQVFVLAGGMKAWQQDNLPLVKSPH